MYLFILKKANIYLLIISENHRTQTQYDDGLILKLFLFQFANSYTSLFYIAFLRGVCTYFIKYSTPKSDFQILMK